MPPKRISYQRQRMSKLNSCHLEGEAVKPEANNHVRHQGSIRDEPNHTACDPLPLEVVSSFLQRNDFTPRAGKGRCTRPLLNRPSPACNHPRK
jgi:hypothetical protein